MGNTLPKNATLEQKIAYFSKQKCEDDIDAEEEFQSTIVELKQTKNWTSLIDVLECIASISVKNNNYRSAAMKYKEIAEISKRAETNKYVQYLTLSAEYYVKSNNFDYAAKNYVEIGDYYKLKYKSDPDLIDLILQNYDRGLELYSVSFNFSSENKVKLKIADTCSMLCAQYERAYQLYEDVAKSYGDSSLLKFSVNKLYFNACLCRIAGGDVIGAQVKLNDYGEIHPFFNGSREEIYLKKIIECIEEEDTDRFTETNIEYDTICPFDEWTVHMLLVLKKEA